MVRGGEAGLELLANNAEHYIRRVVAEEDFAGGADAEVLLPKLLAIKSAVFRVSQICLEMYIPSP